MVRYHHVPATAVWDADDHVFRVGAVDGDGRPHGRRQRWQLDLASGRVLGHEHEEGAFDDRRAFADLDGWAFAMVRVQLVAERRTDAAAVGALFARLGLGAGTFELEVAAR